VSSTWLIQEKIPVSDLFFGAGEVNYGVGSLFVEEFMMSDALMTHEVWPTARSASATHGFFHIAELS